VKAKQILFEAEALEVAEKIKFAIRKSQWLTCAELARKTTKAALTTLGQ